MSRPAKPIQPVLLHFPFSFLPPHTFKVPLIILFINSKEISRSGTKLESKRERGGAALVFPSPLWMWIEWALFLREEDGVRDTDGNTRKIIQAALGVCRGCGFEVEATQASVSLV